MREKAIDLLTALVADVPGREQHSQKWLPILVQHLSEPKHLHGKPYLIKDVLKWIDDSGDSSEHYRDAVTIFCSVWNDPILSNALAPLADFLAADYARIYALMLDRQSFTSCLSKLNQGGTPKNLCQPDTKWLSLNHRLSVYERLCWFPTEILLPMGILTSTDFYFYIRRGYVLKDYGAGVKHGEFTHRLQWHVIMANITNNFTVPIVHPWKHSPFELYIFLGAPPLVTQRLWGYLFDRPGDGDNSSFSHPDVLHQWLLQHTSTMDLTGCLSRRETKRRLEFLSNVRDFIAQEKGKALRTQLQTSESLLKDASNNHALFRKFDQFLAESIYITEKEKVQATKVYSEISSMRRADYIQRKTAVISKDALSKSGRSAPYSRVHRQFMQASFKAPGPVYAAVENFRVMTLGEVESRRIESRQVLQKQK